MSAESAYNTSKAASRELVDSLLGGSALNYVGHRAYVRGASAVTSKEAKHVELAELARRKSTSSPLAALEVFYALYAENWGSGIPKPPCFMLWPRIF